MCFTFRSSRLASEERQKDPAHETGRIGSSEAFGLSIQTKVARTKLWAPRQNLSASRPRLSPSADSLSAASKAYPRSPESIGGSAQPIAGFHFSIAAHDGLSALATAYRPPAIVQAGLAIGSGEPR